MKSLRFLPALLLVARAGSLDAQADTAKRDRFFSWRDASMLEAFAIATVSAAPLDRKFAERLQNQTVQENRLLRNTAHTVEAITDPGAMIIGIGLYTYGRIRNQGRVADLGLHGTEALVLGGQLAFVMKGIAGRARPYVNTNDPHNYSFMRGFREGTDYRAFPSGHAISAFAAAAAVTSEAKRWWGTKAGWIVGSVLYTGAAGVAWSRMYDNKHWATDVLTGAAIGTFTGLKVVHYHHKTNPNNWIDRRLLEKPKPAAATEP
jgi:membrane-associated phospholipid phosphatase